MSEEKQKTCQVKMHDGKPCGRPVYRDGKCVCHSDYGGRNADGFRAEVYRILKDKQKEVYDFTSFVFPRMESFLPPEVDKKIVCQKARFLDRVDFNGITFCEDAVFDRAVFETSVIFQGAEFKKKAEFTSARFKGMTFFSNCVVSGGYFEDAKFLEHVSFSNTDFAGYATFFFANFMGDSIFNGAKFKGAVEFIHTTLSGTVTFGGTEFLSTTLFTSTIFGGKVEFLHCTFGEENDSPSPGYAFRNARFEQAARVLFDGTDLKGKQGRMFLKPVDFKVLNIERGAIVVFRRMTMNNCFFLETDLSLVSFSDVAWPSRGRWINQRGVVADEPVVGSGAATKYAAVAQLYRGLQSSYTESYRYPEAGDFFVGEQIMMRRASKNPLARLVSLLYGLLSRYGQSYFRPLILLLATIFGIPYALLKGGIVQRPEILDQLARISTVKQTYMRQLLADTSDYWFVFWKNISWVGLNSSDSGNYLITSAQQGILTLERLWILVLVTFFVLALRRAFRRKSF